MKNHENLGICLNNVEKRGRVQSTLPQALSEGFRLVGVSSGGYPTHICYVNHSLWS